MKLFFTPLALSTALLTGTCSAASVAEFVDSSPGKRYLGPEFIERYSHEYDPYGLASLLATQPGVALQSNGDPGGEDWLTFRGNPRDSSRMTLVLLDGVPLNSASNSTLEFNTVPLSLIHDITIYYGPLPVRYGGYTSVVELRTKQASDRTEVLAYVGSLDTLGGGVTASRTGSNWGWTFDLQAHETRGLEGEETIHRTVDNSNPLDPAIVTEYPEYESRDYQQIVPTFTGAVTFGNGMNLGLLAQGIFTDKDYADGHSEAEPDRPANREREFYNLGLSLSPSVSSGQDYSLNVFYKDEQHEQLALDDEFVNYGEQEKSQFGVRGHFGFSLTQSLTLSLGGEFNDYEGEVVDDTAWDPVNEEIIYFESSEDFDSVYFTHQDSLDNQAAFADLGYQMGDTAVFSAGVRYDDVENTDSETSYQLSAEFQVTDSLRLHISGGETARYPSLNEYNNSLREPLVLGPPIPGIVDPEDVADQNGELEMEKMSGGEIGLSWTALDSALVTELVVFDYEHEGEIFIDVRTVPNQLDPNSILYNILGPDINLLLRNNRPTEDQSRGAEISVNYNTEKLGLFLNATWNELEREYTDGRSSHNQPFMPPEYFANGGAYYEIGRGKIDAQFEYRGETDDSLQERGALPDVKIDSSFLFHLGYRHQISDRLEVFARAYNLFDEEYETFYGLPMVERHITGGIKFQF